MINDASKRHEFVLLFDVRDGNPNGDPDAGNLPRVDPETMHGIVTDVALKRKVRDYVQLTRQMPIFIQSKTALNSLIAEAAQKVGAKKDSKVPNEKTRNELCSLYYDIRMFGAVLSTGEYNAGQVRGPMQLTFARSIDPVLPLDLTITRQARTTEERMASGETEMGRKPIIPYGLYRSHGFFNPFLAKQTGVNSEDLSLFWEALMNLFDLDRSAARGEMTVRGLWVFSHDKAQGSAPAHKLFDLIKVNKKSGVDVCREFTDYQVDVLEDVPSGVVLESLA